MVRKRKKLKEAFNELYECVNTNYKNYFTNMIELKIDKLWYTYSWLIIGYAPYNNLYCFGGY